MKRKQGISLIVLVITIIVMIILAASVVITLSNTGVINRADQAVQVTNEKQIEQLANTAWADAYAGGKRTEEELKGAVEQVLAENKVDTNKIAINVTEKGVEVSDTVFEVYPLEVAIERGPIIKLKAKVPVDYKNVYVTVERGGSTKTITECKTEDDIKIFEYEEGIQYMWRTNKIKLHATYEGNEIVKEFDEITIENYAKSLLQKSAAELNMSAEKYAALRNLLGDMLEYGAMAQIYTGKNTTDLVNEGITEKTTYTELKETEMKLTNNNSSSTTYFKSASVYFNTLNSVSLIITTDKPDDVKVKITVDGNSVTKTSKDFENVQENLFRIYTDDIELIDYDKLFTIELYEGEVLRQTLLYSVKCYVYNNQNKFESDGTTLQPIGNLVRAMYNYSLSAKAYINAK